MGKSTAMKYLSVKWAEGTLEDLDIFDFVFHVALKHVRKNNKLEKIIIAQHCGLEANNVKPHEIKSILDGETKSRVLVIMDGHDEYRSGLNTAIDDALEKRSLWNCWIILTSRETGQIKGLKEHMDIEIELHGFSKESVAHYIAKSFDNIKQTNKLLRQIAESGLCDLRDEDDYFGHCSILGVPMFLNMICTLFCLNQKLPNTMSKIMDAVVDRYVDREAIREKGRKALEHVKQIVINLGKLAWEGLKDLKSQKLVFDKVIQTYKCND